MAELPTIPAGVRAARVAKAIQECDRYIAKEGPRDPNLRPPDIQKLLDFYIEHRKSLVSMLDDINNRGAQHYGYALRRIRKENDHCARPNNPPDGL